MANHSQNDILTLKGSLFTKEIVTILLYLVLAVGLYIFPNLPFEHDAMYYVREDHSTHSYFKYVSTKANRITSNISIIDAVVGDGWYDDNPETKQYICYKNNEGKVFVLSYHSHDLEIINKEISNVGSINDEFLENTFGLNQYYEIRRLSKEKHKFLIPIIIVIIICLLIIFIARYVYGKWALNKDDKPLDEDQQIIYNYCYDFAVFAEGVLFIALFFLWFIFFCLRGYDLFFLLLPPFFFYFTISFLVLRESDEFKNEKKDNIIEKKEPESIHQSYAIQRKGKKSWNPIILILDFLYQRYPGRAKETLVSHYAGYDFAFMITFGIFSLIFDRYYTEITILFLSLWVIIFILSLFNFGNLYRHLRHKYIKKNNLPGPYGWGTIDYNCSESYKDEQTYNLNGPGGYGHGAGWVSGHYRSGHYRNGHWVSGHQVRSHWRN